MWHDIKGYYRGCYFINDKGQVKNKKGNILKPATDKGGYKWIILQRNKVKKYKYIHRLVAECLLPNPHNKKEVNHKNGIKDDNRVENLEWCTPSENVLHSIKEGLRVPLKGSEIGNSKLKESDVITIKNMLKKGDVLQKNIAEMFNITPTTVSDIKKGRSWSHIKIKGEI
jgi:predicted XRE-type DNA-binding protein